MENGGLEPDLSEAIIPTPIAQLQPGLSDTASHVVDGEVTITWPFSIVTKSVAFKLAEHDFLLRRNKGQVRVEFHGAAGKAVAATGIGGGDKVRLSLAGVEWTEGAPASTRPDTLQWQMNFSSRLRMRVRRADSQEEEIINVDSSDSIENDSPLTELTAPSVSELEPSIPIPNDTPLKPAIYPRAGLEAPLTGKRQVSEAFDTDEYASPAYLKRARISYGSLFEGGLDIFDEHDDDVPSKKRDKKRPRFSMNANWKYTSRTPSPEPEHSPEVEPEPLAGNKDAHEVLMETPSRLPVAGKEGQDGSSKASASPVPSKATETKVLSPQRASTPNSPCPPSIPRTEPEEEPQNYTEQNLKSSGDTDPSLQLAEVDAQSELEKTSAEPDSLPHNDAPKPHDIMDQFLHDAIDPALTDEAGEAADLVLENDAGRFLEDHDLQFAPMPTYAESQPPMGSFSHLPNGEPHVNHSFSAFPTQSNDWLPMSSAPVYPPIPASNSFNNPVEIIDSSSDEEQSSDEGDAEREDDEGQLRGSSLKSEGEDSDHSHMEDSEQEALQQGREDFQMDDNESEEGTDVAGEDYDLRNYDDAQDDDSAGSESEEEGLHRPNGAGHLLNMADEQSSHFINEHGSLNNGEIRSPARAAGLVPVDGQADSDSESEEEDEDDEEQEEEEYYEREEGNVHGYEEEEYYEEGEEEYEEEDEEEYGEEADNSTPPPPQEPVFIDLMSDSDDEDELDQQEPHKEEPEAKGSADAHEPDTSAISAHQEEALSENEESQDTNLAFTQGTTTTEETASINVDASKQPIPAHPDQSNHSATEHSVVTVLETLVSSGKQSQSQSNPLAATDLEPHVDSITHYEESQETVTISNGQTQTQTVVGLGEQSPEIQRAEMESQVTESQEIESKGMRAEISSPSFEDATSQEKDGSTQEQLDVDMDVPPAVEQGGPTFTTHMEQSFTADTPEQPATGDLPPTEPTQGSPVSASKPSGLSATDENMGASIGKASSPMTEQTSPKLVESVSAEITSNIAVAPTGQVPTVELPAALTPNADGKDLPNDSAGEDTAMQEASLIVEETHQLESLQQTDPVQDEIEVKDGLDSLPPTEISQQAQTTDEVAQPVAGTVEVEEVIYVERAEEDMEPHESPPNDAMDIDQVDDEHDHDAEYSFAAEQQIISESQGYQDKPMTDTLQPEADTATSVPSEPVEKKKATAKPEQEMLITVQSLRSRGHRKSLSSDSTSTHNQDPSILLAKANTGAAEPEPRRKHKTPPVIHTGRITRSQVEAGVGQTAGSPHTPTRSTRLGATPETPHGSQASGATRKGRSKSPASTSELLKTPSVAGSPAAAAAADGEPISELKLRLSRDLRTNLGDFTPLKSLRMASKMTNILAIATRTPPQPSRPKNGPRDYMVELILTDPSCAPSTVVVAHFFRPHQAALPTVHVGDVVLLRQFQIVSVRKRGFGIRTSEESAWAVFEKDDEEQIPQIKGPPVEPSDAEVSYAEGLRRWWTLLDDKVKTKIEKATEKTVQLGARDEK
ncbi:unnamed protein product [Clonostachys byssicola]|uniref:Telomeric single stranded DNA binding POT1/Cdc13 domain-containing protein n=1 Tax=Clonostachys byssicola TaxID=160290 RepID=A0A9N9UR77_9HYPO|nr:unnamed protein product [Clonostachys byssicola]